MKKDKDYLKQQKIWYSKLKESGFKDIEVNPNSNKVSKYDYITYENNEYNNISSFYEGNAFFQKLLEFKNNKLNKILIKNKVEKDEILLYNLITVMLCKGFTTSKMRDYLKDEYKIKTSNTSVKRRISNIYQMLEKDPFFKNCKIQRLDTNPYNLSAEPWDTCQCCNKRYLVEMQEKSTHEYCEKCVNKNLN